MRVFFTLVLSATMALPPQAYAAGSSQSPGRPATTEGVPVVLQPIVDGNGREALLAIAPVPQNEEAGVVTRLANSHPDNTILMVSGQNDPALKAAAKTGFLKRIKTFIASSVGAAPIFSLGTLSAKTEEKLRAKIEAMRPSKSDTSGIMLSLIYGGTIGVSTFYASGSVEAGLAITTMYFLWNSLLMFRPEFYNKAVDFGGNTGIATGRLVASLFGRELSEREKHLYEVLGRFAVAWSINFVQASAVKYASGDFSDLVGVGGFFEGMADTANSANQNSYNVWDLVALRLYSEGRWTEKQVQRYFKFQMVVGGVAESLAYRGVPYVGLFLGTLTATGLVYVALTPQKQAKLNRTVRKLNLVFRAGIAHVVRPERRRETMERVAEGCDRLLRGRPQTVIPGHRAGWYEDIH